TVVMAWFAHPIATSCRGGFEPSCFKPVRVRALYWVMVDRVGPTPPQEGALVQADELFRQLDAQQIWHTRRVWHVRVDSITHENDEWWMQLRLAGPLIFDI